MGGPGSGPRRTPTSELAARGSWLADVREGIEPAVPPGPTTPRGKGLNAKARKEFNHWVKVLAQMRVMTQVDVGALEAYCREYVRYTELSDWLDRAGPVRVTRGPSPGRDPSTGAEIPGEVLSVEEWPQVRQMGASFDRLLKLTDRLGFCPTARARMRVEPAWTGGATGPRGVVPDPFAPPPMPSSPFLPSTPMPPTGTDDVSP